MKKFKTRMRLWYWLAFYNQGMHDYMLCSDENFIPIIRMAHIKIIRLRRELKNLSYKPFYILFNKNERDTFRNSDIIKLHSCSNTYIILETNVNNTWWRNLKRQLGLKTFNYNGYVKVKQHDGN